MPELRQAGDVVDLDYPPFFIDRADPATRKGTTPAAAAIAELGDTMVSGWLNDGAGSSIPSGLTLQQAALVSAPAAGIYVCENPAAPALS